MSTLIGSPKAAELLNVTTATLYAYVSRGRLSRTRAADGRTSLFDRAEVERLAARNRRSVPGPRPTIDVAITSRITTMVERRLHYRGHDVVDLVSRHRFEDIAELLWSDAEHPDAPYQTTWPAADTSDIEACAAIRQLDATAIGRLAIAAHVLGARHPDDDAPSAARRLLGVVPSIVGSTRRTGPFALRLAGAYRRRPAAELVDAVDTALGLLADHELATSTLAVRIAASVRPSPYVGLSVGLASVEGELHGSAAATAHRFLEQCANEGPGSVATELRGKRRGIPGFGHAVYRTADPRFAPLLDVVRPLDSRGERIDVVERTVAEVGRILPDPPNVDLALAALTWIGGLDPSTPIFAIARIAGWSAHYAEELQESPIRFRGVARPV